MSDLAVRGFSLSRPLAGAVVRGPCRVLNLPEISVALPGDGFLVVIHAQDRWIPQDLPGVRELWPDCPGDPASHEKGYVGVGLAQRVEWIPANGAGAEDPWALGPWALFLDQVVPFKPSLPMLGWQGLFAIEETVAARIRRAWEERPHE